MERDYKKAIAHTARILDAWLPQKIKYEKIPGLSVGIFYKGKIIYSKGFGYADIGKKEKMTSRHNFRIASISKIFTAIAIMQLVENNKLKLSDTVEKYLPWFKAKNKNLSTKNITLRQLLSHSAGILRDGKTPHWRNYKFPQIDGLKKSAGKSSLVFKNATHFKYSNFGFSLLGEIIHKVSGLAYEEYVQENIIKRLKLESTYPDYDKSIKNLAIGYSKELGFQKRRPFPHMKTNAYASATGFISNVHDLSNFLLAISSDKNSLLIKNKNWKEMIKLIKKTGEKNRYYGLGLESHKIGKRKIFGHGGGFFGFITRVSVDPKNEIGVITLSNTYSDVGYINKGIFETVYWLKDNKRKMEGKNIDNPERFEGLYRNPWGEEIVVACKNILVVFEPSTHSPFQQEAILQHFGSDKFLIKTKSNFDYPGETAKFIFKNKKRAAQLIWGPNPASRVG